MKNFREKRNHIFFLIFLKDFKNNDHLFGKEKRGKCKSRWKYLKWTLPKREEEGMQLYLVNNK